MDKLRIIILTLFSFQRLFVSIAFANFHVTGDSQYGRPFCKLLTEDRSGGALFNSKSRVLKVI